MKFQSSRRGRQSSTDVDKMKKRDTSLRRKQKMVGYKTSETQSKNAGQLSIHYARNEVPKTSFYDEEESK